MSRRLRRPGTLGLFARFSHWSTTHRTFLYGTWGIKTGNTWFKTVASWSIVKVYHEKQGCRKMYQGNIGIWQKSVHLFHRPFRIWATLPEVERLVGCPHQERRPGQGSKDFRSSRRCSWETLEIFDAEFGARMSNGRVWWWHVMTIIMIMIIVWSYCGHIGHMRAII